MICVSNYEKNLVLKNFRLNTYKIFVVDKIKEQKDTSVKRIIYVGRNEKYKGVGYIVKALKFLPDYYILEIVVWLQTPLLCASR